MSTVAMGDVDGGAVVGMVDGGAERSGGMSGEWWAVRSGRKREEGEGGREERRINAKTSGTRDGIIRGTAEYVPRYLNI